MWIVQEVCLSGSLHFVCGHSVWAADQFERILLLFYLLLAHRAGNFTPEDLINDYPQLDDILLAIAIARFLNRIFSTRRTIHRPGQTRMTLFQLLAKFNVVDGITGLTEEHDMQKFRAGDARDCCYSIIALPGPDDPVMKHVTISYESSAQRVFTELAEAIAVDVIDILLFSQNASKQLEALPSWVPDWSSQLSSPYGYLDSSTPLFSSGHAKDSHIWDGGGGACVEGSILTVTGYSVDIIQRTGDYVYKVTGSEDNQPTHVSQHYFLSEIQLFCRLAREIQLDSVESPLCLDEVIWMMATGGRGLANSIGAGRDERLGPEVKGIRLLDAAYQICRQRLERHTKSHEAVCWKLRQVDVLSPLEQRWAELKRRSGLYWGLMYYLGTGTDWEAYTFCEKFHQYWESFGPMASKAADDQQDGWNLEAEVRNEGLNASGRLGRAMDIQQGRRCFLSPKGYVGLGPLEMQVGDVVVVLKGASVPMVLRSYIAIPGGQQQYKYVGEAYCYGTMDGEVFQERARERPVLFHIV
ncbi:hypothetical protein B0I35DRAFT_442323 [Stachybotrys elegans]|uniref:Heterokaryon incompatibility domain-containing protein n=1 Tax=Stachybotrys elegans TaxID=80388 RepID=A0A8K0SL98_9HYPO|nr:hypothetical protein B0I35DRAFT_442323 [Stachybotrys elegans]